MDRHRPRVTLELLLPLQHLLSISRLSFAQQYIFLVSSLFSHLLLSHLTFSHISEFSFPVHVGWRLVR